MDRYALDAAEPVEATILEVATWIRVGDLDSGNPLWVFETELDGSPKPERRAEWLGNRYACIFRGEDRLRMYRRRHVDAAVVGIGAFEGDVLRRQVSTDTFQEKAQIYA